MAEPSSRLLPRPRFIGPAWVTFLAVAVVVGVVIARNGGDPLALARVGTRYSLGNPQGTEGYDGQFVYYIARDPRPASVEPFLDVPAYRYQRILLSLLGRLFSLGNLNALPWVLAALGIAAQTVGVWLVSELLQEWRINRWYALVYGLWVGFLLAVRLDLPEPLAYALVAGALLADLRGRKGLSWGLFAAALFAKEVTLLFLAGQIAFEVFRKEWKNLAGLVLVAIIPFVVFQGWLWVRFGQPGIGSGGAMATSFEWLPFMGLVRIGTYSWVLFAGMLVVFGPFVILPSLWGMREGLRSLVGRKADSFSFALLFNALVVPFVPFSTFREPGGLLRLTGGLVLAVLLFAGKHNKRRVLNYSFLWLVLNVFLIKS